MTTVTVRELSQEVSRRVGARESAVKEILDEAVISILKNLTDGNDVYIHRLGRFQQHTFKGRDTFNIVTKKFRKAKDAKYPRLKFSPIAREVVKGTKKVEDFFE